MATYSSAFPFLTAYDPPGTGEGSLDPLGLSQIADQLAMQLVPGIRERMQRIRFLTALAVGALVREDVEVRTDDPNSSDYLVWEWLVVEAIVRSLDADPSIWGVPGTHVTRRAVDRYGYVDARSYLKVSRVFGFHGVYKRLAVHLGIVDVHLGPGPQAESLADAWARGIGLRNLNEARPLFSKWRHALNRSIAASPPRTKPQWSSTDWEELAHAFAPAELRWREKRLLRDLLLASDEIPMGALPALWKLQPEFNDNDLDERILHERLEHIAPELGALLEAIRSYEFFARSLQDAFDLLRAEAARPDGRGYPVTDIGRDEDFRRSTSGLHEQHEATHRALEAVPSGSVSLPNLFAERFARFAEPLEPAACALALCEHHEAIQRAKSADGKRPWFDRLGEDRIYMRHSYRITRQQTMPDRYAKRRCVQRRCGNGDENRDDAASG